jgi:uncharacterized membrane protein
MTQTRFAAGRKWIALVAVLVGVALLVLPLTSPTGVPLIFLFVGRLHPLVLHFPIVLSLLALCVELLRLFVFRRISIVSTGVLVGCATLSAWVTIAAGYFLYASGEYSGELIMRHFWAGTLSGSGLSLALAILIYYNITGRLYVVFLTCLLLTNAAVAYASHLGGTVTHGQEYLVEYLNLMRASDKQIEKADRELLLYADMVAPVLEARCASCHNRQRAKGGLTMDTYPQLFGAGDSNHTAIVPGSLSKSEMLNRIYLPLHDDEHMPPEGKSPMTSDEIALLAFWVKGGASDTARVWPARGIDSMRAPIGRLLPELRKYQLRLTASRVRDDEAYASLQPLAKGMGINVGRDSLSDEGKWKLSAAMPPHPLSAESMRLLAPYYDYFSGIALPSSAIEDDLLYYFAQMPNVRSLFLQKNAIDGSGLVYLSRMTMLETLNLSYTRIDDRHALELINFPSLKRVYLFRTNVSPDVIKAIRRYRPGLEILEEEGPYL